MQWRRSRGFEWLRVLALVVAAAGPVCGQATDAAALAEGARAVVAWADTKGDRQLIEVVHAMRGLRDGHGGSRLDSTVALVRKAATEAGESDGGRSLNRRVLMQVRGAEDPALIAAFSKIVEAGHLDGMLEAALQSPVAAAPAAPATGNRRYSSRLVDDALDFLRGDARVKVDGQSKRISKGWVSEVRAEGGDLVFKFYGAVKVGVLKWRYFVGTMRLRAGQETFTDVSVVEELGDHGWLQHSGVSDSAIWAAESVRHALDTLGYGVQGLWRGKPAQ